MDFMKHVPTEFMEVYPNAKFYRQSNKIHP